jgi:hypothetical protein
MITKSKLALVATLVAVSFATPAFAQTFAFSGAEPSVHYNGPQSHGNFAPTAQDHRAAFGKNGCQRAPNFPRMWAFNFP